MTTTIEPDFAAAADALRARRVVCVAHVDPDADTLGSALALAHALRSLGTDAVVAIGSADGGPVRVPERLRTLPGVEELVVDAVEAAPPVLAVLDCSEPDRLGTRAALLESAGTVVWIDHHERGAPRGDVTVVDPHASATCELVAVVVRRLGVPLTGDVAACCFAGLVTDTGRFSNAATSASALRLAADLVEGGVDVAGLSRSLFESVGFDELRLLGRVLAAARRAPGGLVWSTVTEEELTEAGLAFGETDGLVEMLRGVDGTRCALLLKRRVDGRIKGSMRGVDMEVASIARSLGGGGHPLAAGFDTAADEAEVVQRVTCALAGRDAEG